MNVQDYRAAGYALSTLIDQAAVTRAEKDIVAAYIVPLVGHVPTQTELDAEPMKNAVMSLAFLLIQQRSSVATRAGAKIKTTDHSNTPTYADVLHQNAPTCVHYLRQLAPGKQPEKECSDVCGVFFRSTYFATK